MRLSYRMEGVEEEGIYVSSSRDLSQHSFTTVLAKALYSTFVPWDEIRAKINKVR